MLFLFVDLLLLVYIVVDVLLLLFQKLQEFRTVAFADFLKRREQPGDEGDVLQELLLKDFLVLIFLCLVIERHIFKGLGIVNYLF
jgi:hypothetical protein